MTLGRAVRPVHALDGGDAILSVVSVRVQEAVFQAAGHVSVLVVFVGRGLLAADGQAAHGVRTGRVVGVAARDPAGLTALRRALIRVGREQGTSLLVSIG